MKPFPKGRPNRGASSWHSGGGPRGWLSFLILTAKKRHIAPIMSAVGALPQDELAAMAESLVNLTSFKRRVSIESETVGREIDLAVISKGDGFIWIKRKRYFDASKNPHFAVNYCR